MTKLKVIGESREATIVELENGYSFECSQGIWCNRQDEIRVEDSLEDAIAYAEVHVTRHDNELVTWVNGR